MSITGKLIAINISDIVSMTIAALIVTLVVGDFNPSIAIGIIAGNRLAAILFK
jgi:hypothetical protein